MRPTRPALRLPGVVLTAEEVRKCFEFVRFCRTLDALASVLSLLGREMKEGTVSLAELYDYLFNVRDSDRPEDAVHALRLVVRANHDIAKYVLNRAIKGLRASDETLGEMRFTVARGAQVVGLTRKGIAELVSWFNMLRYVVCP